MSINAIKEYDFSNPIDVIYSLMWLEEEFPYYEINFDTESYEKTKYNEMVKNVINEWKEIRDKREIYEISDEEYLDWKLNFMKDTLKLVLVVKVNLIASLKNMQNKTEIML